MSLDFTRTGFQYEIVCTMSVITRVASHKNQQSKSKPRGVKEDLCVVVLCHNYS